MAGFSDAVEAKILDAITGVAGYTVTAPTYLALVTVAVTDAMTAATITEATYTGYARKAVAAADWAATTSGAGTKANANTLTFAACTAGTSTVIGFALVSTASGAGDVIMYGTTASTVISTTQTPATVGTGALVLQLD